MKTLKDIISMGENIDSHNISKIEKFIELNYEVLAMIRKNNSIKYDL